MFWLEYNKAHHACAVLEQPEECHVVGWLISTNGDEEVFKRLLYNFDDENGFIDSQPEVSWFMRTTVDATLIEGENFELDGTIKTYIYYKKPSNVKSSKYLISGNWLDQKNFEVSEEEAYVKRILDPKDNMDNEIIDHPHILANIKKYFKILVKLEVNDTEFFRIIRMKNQNIENIKDHFLEDETKK